MTYCQSCNITGTGDRLMIVATHRCSCGSELCRLCAVYHLTFYQDLSMVDVHILEDLKDEPS